MEQNCTDFSEKSKKFKESPLSGQQGEENLLPFAHPNIINKPPFLNDEQEKECVDETDERIRTFSGSLIPKKVQNIRNYFDQKEESGGEKALPYKAKNQSTKEITQPKKKSTVKVRRNIARKLKTQAKRLVKDLNKERSGSAVLNQNRVANQSGQVDSDTSEEEEKRIPLTVGEKIRYLSDRVDQEENAFLLHLDQQLRMPIDSDDHNSSSNSNLDQSNLSKETVIDIPDCEDINQEMETEVKQISEASLDQRMTSTEETNTAANPGVMSVTDVP